MERSTACTNSIFINSSTANDLQREKEEITKTEGVMEEKKKSPRQRYNEKTYTKYTFSVRKDSELQTQIEEYKKEHPQGFASLVSGLLEEFFKRK